MTRAGARASWWAQGAGRAAGGRAGGQLALGGCRRAAHLQLLVAPLHRRQVLAGQQRRALLQPACPVVRVRVWVLGGEQRRGDELAARQAGQCLGGRSPRRLLCCHSHDCCTSHLQALELAGRTGSYRMHGRSGRRAGAPVAVLPELRQRVLKHLVLLGAAGSMWGRLQTG